jgi:hypothetical protein
VPRLSRSSGPAQRIQATGSPWGRHSIFDHRNNPYLTERAAGYGGSKSTRAPSEALWKKCALECSLISASRIDPERACVHQNVLSECEYSFNVELFVARFTQFQFSVGEPFLQSVA